MDNQQARAELDRLIRNSSTSYAGISRMLGRNAAYIQQFIKRGTPDRLEENDRKKIADFFGVDAALLSGSLGHGEQSKILMVPKLDVQVSAGPGAATDAELAIGHYGFDRRWLRRISNGKPENLSIVRVQGDSMAPSLIDGDDVLVDRIEPGARLRDGIHVLRRDDMLLVKRVALAPTSTTLTISSDNSAYPTWADCALDSVTVLGRVVWSGRRHG